MPKVVREPRNPGGTGALGRGIPGARGMWHVGAEDPKAERGAIAFAALAKFMHFGKCLPGGPRPPKTHEFG